MSNISRIQNHLQFDIHNVQKCSFCGNTRPCVTGTIDGQHICLHCIQTSGEVLNATPAGSVSCLKCHQYMSFTAWYPNYVFCKFEASGLDQQMTTIYRPVATRGVWNEQMVPLRMECNQCKKKVPLDLFDRTKYITNR